MRRTPRGHSETRFRRIIGLVLVTLGLIAAIFVLGFETWELCLLLIVLAGLAWLTRPG